MKTPREKIFVTKTALPPLKEFNKYLEKIWENNWITNHGPFATELEEKLKEYLGVRNLHFVANGTVALEAAIKALDITGNIITTPFSYVATTSSIMWLNCKPVFADIDRETFCIDTSLIESLITDDTEAILATHVFGNCCNIEEINRIAEKYELKVIYDAAHCFGVKYKGQSILNYGDISTISFHATKLFHTVEGGAIVTNDDDLSNTIFLKKSFGHVGDEHYCLGINGKNSEIHAAMGLSNLPDVDACIKTRKKIFLQYLELLSCSDLQFLKINKNTEYNYSYFPAVFPSEQVMLDVKHELEKEDIYPRRYFYPSLNKLRYVNGNSCPVSEDISERILCLPFYQHLNEKDIVRISKIIMKSLKR